ncbi:MAG: isoleucine--tRNA ligase [Methermicoccaceae archaeon]
MFREVVAQYEPTKLESAVQGLWEDIRAYEKTRELRARGKPFNFVDGPPYTTGNIHLGTAWNKIIKDVVLRYRSMCGYHVHDRPGWDMHGLPIEVKVEGLLGFRSKKNIEEYGVDRFTQACRSFALENKDAMTEQFKALGVWMNWDDPYMTLTNEYMDAVWWALARAFERGFVEKGLRVVNWCPRCETAIADSEVEYWDETDPSVYVKFRIKGEPDTYIVIWTTTPWTLPANVAVAVDPDAQYSWVEAEKGGTKETLVLMSSLVEDVLKKGRYRAYTTLRTARGASLVGMEYESPFVDEVPAQREIEHRVYAASFVSEENTGCVHIAPGHGMDDFELGTSHGLEIFCPVGEDGKYTSEAGVYEGLYVKSADEVVMAHLREKGLVLAEETIVHRYGHCWRCKSPILYLATEQWFLNITAIREKMLDEIERVHWTPDWAGSARFRDWIENSRDWCISRQRYWGIPIPIWECERCGATRAVATQKELRQAAGIEGEIDMHRPFVDRIHLRCECGGTMHRVEDVFDVWFDSAVASWATRGYPSVLDSLDGVWPSDFITEGHDQTRGWFYSQLGASILALGRAPYKSVLMHGFTLDEEGRKMSKSLGNVVRPEEVVERYGADTLRMYVLSANAPWEDLRFSWEEVANTYRALNVLWNTYRFPLPYMVMDGFDAERYTLESVREHMRPEDVWIISRLHTTIREVREGLDSYHLHRSTRALLSFILDDLSRWYIQLVRPRTWREADDPDKLAAYATLYTVLTAIANMSAPFMPHVAEEMYQNLVRGTAQALESVHMCDYIEPDASLIQPELEGHMSIVRAITEAVSNVRQKAKRKLRWPVREVVVAPSSDEVKEACAVFGEVLRAQTNAKSIRVLDVGEVWGRLKLEVVPKPAVIGPRYTKDAGRVMAALSEMDGNVLKEELSRGGCTIEVDGRQFDITPDMVELKTVEPEDVYGAEIEYGMVYVDAALTDEIVAEGYAKEVIRRIQEMRKQMQLDILDTIRVGVHVQDLRVAPLLQEWKEHIASEVRASTLDIGNSTQAHGTLVKEWNVDGVVMAIGVSRDE